MKKYETYKESGIKLFGEIPSHWGILRNKNIFSAHYEPVGERMDVPLLSLSVDGVKLRNVESGKGKFPKDFEKYNVVYPGQIIFCLFDVDETPRTVGLCNDYGMITNAYSTFNIGNKVLANFITYYYTAIDDVKALRPYYSGLRKVVQGNRFMQLKVPIPPMEEQGAIVAFLDNKTGEIDDLVAQVEREIVLLKEYKQAEIARVVTKGLNPNVPMKPSGISWIGDIPEHWKLKSLRNYLRLVSDKGHPNEQLLSVVREQGVIIRDVESQDENHNFIPDDLSGYKLVKAGQFAINKMKSWQGSYGVSSYQGIVSPAYYVCDLNFGNKQFFNEAIRSKVYVPFFTQYSKGIRVGQWDLSPIGLKSIPFIEPPFSEQQEIVEYINHQTTEIDRLMVELTYQVEYLKEYKQRLIADVVTGKINVQPN